MGVILVMAVPFLGKRVCYRLAVAGVPTPVI
jgi:hypothetical protein